MCQNKSACHSFGTFLDLLLLFSDVKVTVTLAQFLRKGETACSLSISEHFPKVSEETSKVPEGQRNASDYFPKMFEDYGNF